MNDKGRDRGGIFLPVPGGLFPAPSPASIYISIETRKSEKNYFNRAQSHNIFHVNQI